jgi:diacylglycerol kinase family enzyme
VFTERPGHAAELAVQHAPHTTTLFALGGDGTVMEVAGAVSGSEARVGVLAGGTGNLLARAGHSVVDSARDSRACSTAASSESTGEVRFGRRFAIAAGVGIDADMVAETPSWMKQRLGVWRTRSLDGARHFARCSSVSFSSARDDRRPVHERDAAAVMIANFGAVLGIDYPGSGHTTDDGVLDACVFSPRTLSDAMRIMSQLLRGRFDTDPSMFYGRGRDIRVETTPPLPWQADGELMGTDAVLMSSRSRSRCGCSCHA